jgi:FMN phosphatase YigB (HAD superfamily)
MRIQQFMFGIFVLCSLSTFAYSDTSEKTKATIFDLGEVFIITDGLSAARTIGFSNFIYFGVNNIAKIVTLSDLIERRLFSVLETIEPYREDEVISYSPKGLRIPQIMCSWMKNERSNVDTLYLVKRTLREHPEYCTSDAERNLLISMATMMFTPATFAQTRKLAPGALELVKECKKHGPLYILSNWDHESLEYVKEKFPEFFNEFDADKIFISGDTGIMKPDPKAYSPILEKYNPADCTFVDDRPENTQTALDLGMHVILCPQSKGPNLAYVKTALFGQQQPAFA